MTPSSPSPPGALHQYTNSDGDQDHGPESSEPIEVEPAKLVKQEDRAQTDQHERSYRYTRTSATLFGHQLSFNRRGHRLSFYWCSRVNTLGHRRLAGASEQVQIIQTERIGRPNSHQFRLRSLVGLD